jgi:NAD(P)H-hydrate repair Nnr-like enzyme with NAD(P)H-hydrate epimerase domain
MQPEALTTIPQFVTRNGQTFCGLSRASLQQLRLALHTEYGLLPCQLAEAASYSMAMVVRYALGLSAKDGRVCAIVGDHLSGHIALATLRHLVCAGATAHIVFAIPQGSAGTPELNLQLAPLEKMGIIADLYTGPQDIENLSALLSGCHNVLSGLFDLQAAQDGPEADSSYLDPIIMALNEHRIPVHSLEAPLGIDVDSGLARSPALFSSSTLSLAAPLIGLASAANYVGRHYLCDLSVAAELYQAFGANLAPLFSEQPVVQILPHTPAVPEEKMV